MSTRKFGGKNDDGFWKDKPMQKDHPVLSTKTAVITPTAAGFELYCRHNSNDGREYVHIDSARSAEIWSDKINSAIDFGSSGTMSDYSDICRILKLEVA